MNFNLIYHQQLTSVDLVTKEQREIDHQSNVFHFTVYKLTQVLGETTGTKKTNRGCNLLAFKFNFPLPNG